MARIAGPNSGVGTPNVKISDHQQNGDDRVGRADQSAAQREDERRDYAHLRQQINAEHPGGAEGEVRDPISKRRADIRAKWRIVRNSEQVREVAGRRGIEQRRHRHPQRRLREHRKPEDQPRTRAQRFDVKGDVKHRALGHFAKVSVASEGRNPKPQCSHYEVPKANRKTAATDLGLCPAAAPGMTPCSKRLERCA